jgi:hypothetical protein
MDAENKPRFIFNFLTNFSPQGAGLRPRLTSEAAVATWPYTMRFLPVQKKRFFVYLNSRNEAILKKLSDSLATTDLN